MYTIHAEKRCNQRGIRHDVVEILLTYGERRYRGGGASICYMDRSARHRARRGLGNQTYARVADRLDTYIVLAEDEAIITAAPRRGRLKV
ncbi:hypothetical protein FHS85_004484 [Rhodoligotrophos appendicifer]|uniref:hypothetical protein n=1 Tax=Rhodoligotrophos appendicifer TaxID=987056 RepID=UPI001186BA2C|nr:hypothetical protein [Rhodoligotrophos appendicifer]